MPAGALRLAESLMTDTVAWSRAAAGVPVVIDPVTLLASAGADVGVFAGPCRFRLERIPRKPTTSVTAGDFAVELLMYASIPMSAPELRVDDIGTITASLEHPVDIGAQFRVVGVIKNSQSSAQRVQVEAVVG